MAIGKRIKHFRIFRNLLQKDLGSLVGFSGKTTDVRIAQYESETRAPKDDILHTLFALEDMLSALQRQAIALKNSEISKEEYDNWRYNYPESETARTKKRLIAVKKK